MKTKFELTDLQRAIMNYIEEADCPVVYAKEIGEAFDITSQKASGSLRSLENHGYVRGKLIGGGMDKVKVYYFGRN